MEQIKQRSLCRTFFGVPSIEEATLSTLKTREKNVDYKFLCSDWSHKKQCRRSHWRKEYNGKGMLFECERCVTTLRTAARETTVYTSENQQRLLLDGRSVPWVGVRGRSDSN